MLCARELSVAIMIQHMTATCSAFLGSELPEAKAPEAVSGSEPSKCLAGELTCSSAKQCEEEGTEPLRQ